MILFILGFSIYIFVFVWGGLQVSYDQDFQDNQDQQVPQLVQVVFVFLFIGGVLYQQVVGFISDQDIGCTYSQDYGQDQWYHFLLDFNLFWVRSNLLNWELGSQNMCPKLLGLNLPGVGKCSDHVSWPGMYIMSLFFFIGM